MSIRRRRSARIASKEGSLPGKEADLIFEETPFQYVELKTRTPATPYQRSVKSQKRRRGRSVTAAATTDVKTYKVSPQSGQINEVADVPSAQQLSLQHSSVFFSPLSAENDSFLLAIDKIENNSNSRGSTFIQRQRDCHDDDSPPDVIGDDDTNTLVDLPETSGHTPRRSQKRPVDTESSEPKRVELQPNINVECSKDLFEKSAIAKKPKLKWPKFELALTNRKATKQSTATNRLPIEDPSLTTNEKKLMLSSWGLHPSVLNNYRLKGITSLFPWQLECLSKEKVLEGRNLLYSAPTSAGKTMIAEILMLKRVVEKRLKAIMIVPYVAVAREIACSLQSIFGDAGIRVESFSGNVNPLGGFKAVDIAICTIERANSIINKLLEENALSDLGTLVVDELHMIGEPKRGHLLEILLTKILYITSVKNCGAENKPFHIQVVGMSATLPNLKSLSTWLKAELYITQFRPIPLKGHIKLKDKLYGKELQHVRDVKIDEIPIRIDGDIDDMSYLSLETVLHGFSVLIFCPTKKDVENIAGNIADGFAKIGHSTAPHYADAKHKLRSSLDSTQIGTVLEKLRASPGGTEEGLLRTVGYGIGWHHAGLTFENRDEVESAFRAGILKVIVATTTLSAGVNLPARRVMIYTPKKYDGNVLEAITYHQMCGRAGRKGIDTEGESILICPRGLEHTGKWLFARKMAGVKSALQGDESWACSMEMKRALLEAIVSGIASLASDVRSFVRSTFLSHSLRLGPQRTEVNDSTIEKAVEYLLHKRHEFIRVQKYEEADRPDEYVPTRLGSACVAASFAPDDAIKVYEELSKARKRFVLESQLHEIYQVTPIKDSENLKVLSWFDYLNVWENLDESEKEIGELIGVQESFIIEAKYEHWQPKSSEMLIHKRFYAALALRDLVDEKPLNTVCAKFSLAKADLQQLQRNASAFAGQVTAFCNRLGWYSLELLLGQYKERLKFGVHRQLCELVKLDCLNGRRARILYDAGLENIMQLAAADPAEVECILHKATPFNSNVHGGKESSSSIWMIGNQVMTPAEAARKFVLDAQVFMQVDFGLQGNIQFTFGNDDVPTFAEINQPDISTDASKSNAPRGKSVADGREEAFGMEDNVARVAGPNFLEIQNHPFKVVKERLITSPKEPKVIAKDSSPLYQKKGHSEADGVVLTPKLSKKFKAGLSRPRAKSSSEAPAVVPKRERNGGTVQQRESSDVTSSSNKRQRFTINQKNGNINSAFKQITSEGCNERMVGKSKIKMKIVKSVEEIPSSFFSDSEMIGVGMKLGSHKKPSGSIARQGIGARIVCQNTTMDGQVENCHSLAAYNGVDTVWVLSWESGQHSSNQLENLLGKIVKSPCALATFDWKEKIKSLLAHCGSQILNKLPPWKRLWDPRIAQWMWEFVDEDWKISKKKLIDEYVSKEVRLVISEDVDILQEIIVEAIFAWKVMTGLKEKLLSTELWNHFISTEERTKISANKKCHRGFVIGYQHLVLFTAVEMPSVVPILLMELNGLGCDFSELCKLRRVLQFKSALLELKAFQLAPRQFDLASPENIKQILFVEMRLKAPEGKIGTGKGILQKLEHELPTIILDWRKVANVLQKMIPFQQETSLEATTGRVHGHYSHFTATGRVMVTDPNLQGIPRNFEVHISYDPEQVGEIMPDSRKITELVQQLDNSSEVVDMYNLNNSSLISMRNAFIPCSKDFTLLTADYSQLELRILAHLSNDSLLLAALNRGTDVFIEIASEWKKVSNNEVTDSMRQETKSIVYGVIYGMSSKSLSKQMEIEEREAVDFITQFMSAYPGVRAFIEKTGTSCQEKGFVETMTGRRRYLPLINSRNPQEKAKASRQAVNSQIQGSAADLVKTAMIRIHSFLQDKYPKSVIPIEWDQAPANNEHLENVVCFPILNLHDELIFEVKKTHLEQVANAVQREMESCVNLDVKLPVVIKVGESWGTMNLYRAADT